MKPIRVATICHNEDTHTTPGHRRVRLELYRRESGYVWTTSDGEDPELGIFQTIDEAEEAAQSAWSYPSWDLRASWL